VKYTYTCLLSLLLFSGALRLQAQTSFRSEAPYLLPQTIFVGDPGRLVIPLGRAYAGIDPFVLEDPHKLPETPEMTIRRIELERRGGGSRLLIDFIPYAAGMVSFPPLELFSVEALPMGAVFPTLSGLEVQVASILSPSQMFLSGPASPLAVPGTSLLIYGTILILLLLIALAIAGSFWSRRHFMELWDRLRRRQLLRGMTKFLRRLKQECGIDKGGKAAVYLTRLSGEFRDFLSLFTGINCRSLTAGEFLELPFDSVIDSTFLCRLFRSWDTLRFSGKGMEMDEMFSALEEMDSFVAILDRAEREKPFKADSKGSARSISENAALPNGEHIVTAEAP
jgi:hypothetical protein